MQLGTIERTSGSDNGYFHGTDLAGTLAINSQNSISFSAGYSDMKFNESWKCWIDYNGNGFFENEEIILNKSSNKKGTMIKSFQVPPTAIIGKTRLRISMKRKQPQSPCDTFPHGEVEDYSIQIVPQLIGPLSVVKETTLLGLTLYPNPAVNNLTVQLSQPVNMGRIRLINLLGQDVYESDIRNKTQNLQLDVSTFVPGVYFLEVRIQGVQMVAAKWIKTM